MNTYSFTMRGKVYAPSDEEAVELLHSVCDGVSVESVDTKLIEEVKDVVPAKKPKTAAKPVRKGA